MTYADWMMIGFVAIPGIFLVIRVRQYLREQKERERL